MADLHQLTVNLPPDPAMHVLLTHGMSALERDPKVRLADAINSYGSCSSCACVHFAAPGRR